MTAVTDGLAVTAAEVRRGDLQWCRVCDEQPVRPGAGDGRCGFCAVDLTVDLAEGGTGVPGTPAVVSSAVDVDAGVQAGMFATAYGEHFGRVVALVSRRVWDRALAEDLTQEVFTQLWAEVVTGRRDLAEIGELYPVLATRARWAVSHHWRSTRVRTEAATADETLLWLADAAESPIDLVAARLSVGQLMFGLPFAVRRALALHLWEDLPLAAVAEQTGLSVHTVRAQVAEGLARLRTGMGLSEDLIAAQVAAEDARQRARTLRAMAATARPPARTEQIAGVLRAAITAGTYAPGDRMPGTRALIEAHVPDLAEGALGLEKTRNTVYRALDTLCQQGLVTREGDGYTVTAQAPALATRPKRDPEPARPARAMLAGELLAGLWPVGSTLPGRRTLTARYGCSFQTLAAALNELLDAGILSRPTGPNPPYVVAALPGDDQPGQGTVLAPVPVAKYVPVRERLHQDLQAGLYPPGTRLVQTELATRYGCRHATVGRALADLAALGAAERLAHGGFLVPLSSGDVHHVASAALPAVTP